MSKPPGMRTARERGRLAAASRHGHEPQAIDAIRSDLAAGKVADKVEEWLRVWSPTPEQVAVVTAILAPGEQ